MIDFKNKDELPTNVVICASLIVLVAAGACMKFMPKPEPPSQKQDATARRKIMATTKSIKDKIASVSQELSAKTWPGLPEEIGPVALKQVNGLLQNHHLKLVGFHSQKPIEQPNVTLVPFIVSVDGGFLNVMAFTRDLERSGTKLAVNLFQVSSADQGSDKVTASIGITTYQLPKPTTTDSPSKGPDSKGVKKNA